MLHLFIFLVILVLSPLILFILYIIPFLILSFFEKPTFNKRWIKMHEKMPLMSLDEKDYLYIQNLRHVQYGKDEWDHKVEWMNKKYNFHDLKSIWIFINPYGFAVQAHPVLSLDFGHGNVLSFSYEIRKTSLGDYKSYQCLYKNFELILIAATEHDLIGVRAYKRIDNILHAIKITDKRDEMRKIIQALVDETEYLSKVPTFYRIFHRNCISKTYDLFEKAGIAKHAYIINYLNIFSLMNSVLKKQYKSGFQMRIKTSINKLLKQIKYDENFSYHLHQELDKKFSDHN